MAIRNLAWRAHKDAPITATWDSYILQCNYCVQLIRDDKTIQQKLVKRFCTNRKLLYRHVNSLRQVQRRIPPLATLSEISQISREAANVLQLRYCVAFQSSTGPTIRPVSIVPPVRLFSASFTAEAVMGKLLSLRTNSSSEVGDIRPRSLRAAASDPVEPMAGF